LNCLPAQAVTAIAPARPLPDNPGMRLPPPLPEPFDATVVRTHAPPGCAS
jgi:hypothetical protein